MHAKLHVFTLSILFLAGACDDKEKATDSGTDTAATDGTSTGETSSTTSDDAPTTGANMDDETTGTTGDEPDPGAMEACQAHCELGAACGLGADVDVCVPECVALVNSLGECSQAYRELITCTSELSCAETELPPEQSPCGGAWQQLIQCVDPETCEQSVDLGEDECGVTTECPDAPKQEFTCDGETCTCLEGGVEFATCPADGVCMQGDAIFDKQAECCEFV